MGATAKEKAPLISQPRGLLANLAAAGALEPTATISRFQANPEADLICRICDRVISWIQKPECDVASVAVLLPGSQV